MSALLRLYLFIFRFKFYKLIVPISDKFIQNNRIYLIHCCSQFINQLIIERDLPIAVYYHVIHAVGSQWQFEGGKEIANLTIFE